MNKTILSKLPVTLFVIILCLSSITILNVQAQAENTWTTLAPMPTPRSGLGVVAVNDKIYAIGGTTSSGFAPSISGSAVLGNVDIAGHVGTNEEYNPAKNTWTQKAPMPTPRILFATAVYQNKIYCIGGKTSSGYTAVNEVYNPVTDNWETKASIPQSTGWLKATIVGEKIYAIDYYGNNYQYDPGANLWTVKTPAPNAPSVNQASASFGKKIYVIGGFSQDSYHNLNQIYDTQTDQWSYGEIPSSSHGGGSASATIGENALRLIYVFGVSGNLRQGEEQSFVRVYDPLVNSWDFGTDTTLGRYNFGVAVVNEILYVVGGHIYSYPGDYAPSGLNEEYTPFGYGTPDPNYIPPEPTPTPTPTQTPTPIPEPEFPLTTVIASVVILSIVFLGIFAYFKKRRA